MSDKSKIKGAEVEIDIYEGALNMLAADGISNVSMEYVRNFIDDLRRVLELKDK